MKRTYSKPDVVFESFSLSTSIATGCEVKLDLPTSGGCGVQLPGSAWIVFLEHINGCAIKDQDGGFMANGLCYEVPYESNNIFDS